MNHTVLSQAQLNQLVADAKLGRALREAAEAAGRMLSSDPKIVDEDIEPQDVGEFVADCIEWEPEVYGSEAGVLLRDIVAAAAQEVADEQQELLRDHAEADKDIARGLR